MKKRLGRPKTIENGITRSIYFPEKVLKHFTEVSEKHDISISNAVIDALESTMPNTPEPFPSRCFGEFQLD